MINKRIAISSMSIVAALSLITGATFAFFSDVGTSSANTFATGTMNLKLSDQNVGGVGLETDQDSVTASFGSGSLVPGSCTGDQTLTLKNTGTVAANHAEVHVANVVNDAGSNASPDMDSFLVLNKLTYNAVDVRGQITDSNGNGVKDLADWATNVAELDNLALTDLNVGHDLVMDVCLRNTADNTIQGDSVVSTFTVDLNQDSSQ
jgi:predicted ribosomally synthesized peptide with SipW-like signal peptide